MNQKTDDADGPGTERPDEQAEGASSMRVEVDETSSQEPAGLSPDESTDGPTPAPAPPTSARSGSRLASILAGFALLLALAALGSVGYLAWQGRDIGSEQANTDATVAQLTDNLDESLATLDDLRRRLAELTASDTAYGTELDSLERQLQDLLDRYENVPPRLASLETAMSSLQGISTGVRDNWWLAEAEYYMQIANAQLQLAGNPRLARLALEFADERIRQLGNPGLTEVRRALAQELRALETMEKPDIEGVSMELASLAESVESLPIEEYVTAIGDEGAPVAEDAGAMDRALASVKRAFSDVVSVRRTDETVRPLLSPDARYFLRTNLALQMHAARLALLRGERVVFEQSLGDAASWLREYFDADSPAVTSALATISDIRDDFVAVEAPDISGSLELLRQYRTRSAAESPAPTGTDGGAADTDAQ